jgi:hypothetical protein
VVERVTTCLGGRDLILTGHFLKVAPQVHLREGLVLLIQSLLELAGRPRPVLPLPRRWSVG